MEEMHAKLEGCMQEEMEGYHMYDEMASFYDEHGCHDKAAILHAIAADELSHHEWIGKILE